MSINYQVYLECPTESINYYCQAKDQPVLFSQQRTQICVSAESLSEEPEYMVLFHVKPTSSWKMIAWTQILANFPPRKSDLWLARIGVSVHTGHLRFAPELVRIRSAGRVGIGQVGFANRMTLLHCWYAHMGCSFSIMALDWSSWKANAKLQYFTCPGMTAPPFLSLSWGSSSSVSAVSRASLSPSNLCDLPLALAAYWWMVRHQCQSS